MLKTYLSKYQYFLFAIVFALVGCSGGGGGTDTPTTSAATTDFDGSYDITATSTTPFDSNGGACANASGLLTINNGELSGSVINDRGDTYTISGNVQSSGDVLGGFALSGSNAATFEGVVSGNTGTGTWVDIYQCSGNWQVVKNVVVVGGVYGTLTITGGDQQVPATFVPDLKSVGLVTVDDFYTIWSETYEIYLESWSLYVRIFDYDNLNNGASITFSKFSASTDGYTCESGIIGSYGDCSGATFDVNTRTVTFSNVQLQAPNFGTVITLNGTLTY